MKSIQNETLQLILLVRDQKLCIKPTFLGKDLLLLLLGLLTPQKRDDKLNVYFGC